MNSNLWFQRHELKHELVFGVEPPQISLYFTSKERDVFILKVFQSFFWGGAKKAKLFIPAKVRLDENMAYLIMS